MPLVSARLRIEHDDPVVRIAVCREHLLRCNVDRDVGRRAEPFGGIAIVAVTLLTDLQDKLAIYCELEELAILLAVTGEPDKIIVINEDTVFAFRDNRARRRPSTG